MQIVPVNELRARIELNDDLEPSRPSQVPPSADASPGPFIPPPIERSESESSDAADIDVVLVDARAAVGKSRFARWLASESRQTLLDLAETQVGAGTASGILPQFTRRSDGSRVYSEQAFEDGELTLIVDAIDEGRIRSGQANVDSFLETFAEMIRGRKARRRPAAVIFGRPESILSVKETLEIFEIVNVEVLRIQFFDEDRAREMVLKYAEHYAERDSMRSVRLSPEDLKAPVNSVLDSYFSAVAQALNLDSAANLWIDENGDGRQFAGYAPVLQTLGATVGLETNHGRLAAQLETGRSSAWGVIEKVCQTIFEREQGKVRDHIEIQFPEDEIPSLAYDRKEQVRAIMGHLASNDPLKYLARMRFPRAEMTTAYREAVRMFVTDHPFCDRTDSEGNRDFSNPILGAILVAEAMIQGEVLNPSDPVIKGCGMQGFLWQAMMHRWKEDAQSDEVIQAIDGRYFGLVADSFNAQNAMTATGSPRQSGSASRPMLRLSQSESDEYISASFAESGQPARVFLEVLDTPYLGPVIRDIEVDLRQGAIVIEGLSVGRNEVRFVGSVKLLADAISFKNCTSIIVEEGAEVRMTAASANADARIDVQFDSKRNTRQNQPKRGGDQDELLTFGGMAMTYPWSEFRGGREDDDAVKNALQVLREEGALIRVDRRTYLPLGNHHRRARTALGDALAPMLRELRASGFVETDLPSAGGSSQLALRTAAGIPRLLAAIESRESHALETVERLREILNR